MQYNIIDLFLKFNFSFVKKFAVFDKATNSIIIIIYNIYIQIYY